MHFINTRPLDRADELTQALAAQGFRVECLPLLELVEQPFDAHLNALYQDLTHAQVIVVVSPTAVEIGMRYLQRAGLTLQDVAQADWIAVGQQTAQALSHYGIQAHVPTIESSEGMLHIPVFETQSVLHRVAFWRGEGGRQFMMQHLAEQGIQILNFVLYDRCCPLASKQQIGNIAAKIKEQKQRAWVLISSEASWLNWLALTQHDTPLFDLCDYVVLGERLEQILTIYQNQSSQSFTIIRVENLKAATLLRHLQA